MHDGRMVGEVKMRVIRFYKMSVSVPIKENETAEEVEDRMIEAVDSIGDGVVISYNTEIEEYDDD